MLDNLTLHVKPEEFLLISGASGSGKSTLCRTFNGLIPHFYDGVLNGEVRISGKTTQSLSVSDLFHQVGMVFQNPEAQLFNSTVYSEITFGLESLGLSKKEINDRVSETAANLNITELLTRNPHTLSGGEQQLVTIAAILALHPRLLVLDEPYANLDPFNVRRIRKILQNIPKQGMGVAICEHRLRHTVSDVQRMIVLHKGKVALDGLPSDLLQYDLSSYGLESPVSTRIGRKLGMTPVPLTVSSIVSSKLNSTLPDEFKPVFPSPISKDSPTVLEVEHVSFSINGKQILKNISFTLAEGECLAIVGANGAGKTVLLKQLNGLHRPSQGRIHIANKDNRDFKVSQLAKYVGIAFQNPNSQFFKLNVWDEISVGPKTLGCYDESWLRELVNLFRLAHLVDRAPFRLSGGEKKRVAFAAAMAAKPIILALDEPTAGQDAHFRHALGELLITLRERGQAVILVTHDMGFAEQHAHRWLLLAEGEVVAEGAPWDVQADLESMRRAHLEPTEAFRLYHKSVQPPI